MLTDLCILIPSCDRYADLWEPFFQLFWKYWPDCPYPVYLGANSLEFSAPGVRQILIGADPGWSDGLLKMLAALDDTGNLPYVLLLLDDFFFTAAVDTPTIQSCAAALDALGGNCLRLRPQPPLDHPVEGYDRLGEIAGEAPYRFSLQAAIWRRSALQGLLRPAENPWQVEVLGSQRAARMDGFYGTLQPALYYLNGVERGRWFPQTLEFLRSQGIEVDASQRGVAQVERTSGCKMRQWLLSPLRRLPLRQRLLLRAWLHQWFGIRLD